MNAWASQLLIITIVVGVMTFLTFYEEKRVRNGGKPRTLPKLPPIAKEIGVWLLSGFYAVIIGMLLGRVIYGC